MSKLMIALGALVLGIGAYVLLARGSAPVRPAADNGGAPGSRRSEPSSAAALEVPPAPVPPSTVGDGERTAQQGVGQMPLEIVDPLLELNLIQDGNVVAGSDPEAAQRSIDELLETKHYKKTHDQLDLSLRSVEAVLAQQTTPDLIPKDKRLSEEALKALRIEAAWLKEKVYNQ